MHSITISTLLNCTVESRLYQAARLVRFGPATYLQTKLDALLHMYALILQNKMFSMYK